MVYVPGTTLDLPEEARGHAFTVLTPVFALSGGGLLLSQITEMTGLSPSTIQNWVKRGWVENPVNKRYNELKVARILILNLLRPAMQLEKIVTLMTYINGRVDDRSDDIIPDPQLFEMLCSAILTLDEQDSISEEYIRKLAAQTVGDYEGPFPGAHERLIKAITLMLMNTAAAELMRRAEGLYTQIAATEQEEESL